MGREVGWFRVGSNRWAGLGWGPVGPGGGMGQGWRQLVGRVGPVASWAGRWDMSGLAAIGGRVGGRVGKRDVACEVGRKGVQASEAIQADL